LVEHKEKRGVLSRWGNDLRQSYRTLGQAAGVSEVDMHLLMNHSLPGINAGYITRSKLMGGHLRQQQGKLSGFIIGAVVGRGLRPSTLLSRWLNSTSRDQLAALLSDDPDDIRTRFGSRSAMRKLEIQGARCDTQRLDDAKLSAPARRLRDDDRRSVRPPLRLADLRPPQNSPTAKSPKPLARPGAMRG
jgi:hypothetical protein